MASWLVRSSTDRTVRVRALAGDTVLCSWARHFTLTVPLSTQEYKWVPGICWGNLTNCWGVTCDGLASRPGGVEILLAASCYGNRDKLRPDEPVGSIRLHFFFTKKGSCKLLIIASFSHYGSCPDISQRMFQIKTITSLEISQRLRMMVQSDIV